VDDQGVVVDCGDGTPFISSLAPGAMATCTGTQPARNTATATAPYKNIGTAVGTPDPVFPEWQAEDDRPVFDDVVDTDPAHYYIDPASVPPLPPIPGTGSNSTTPMLMMAALMLMAGVVLMAARRRRSAD
ncbi:MAG TPA: hypothetical protein DCR14_09325, partial [Acidimicrobiaceae bacterium]|nr:hypothetical protein [Acidimicrobiaceae bacterium]